MLALPLRVRPLEILDPICLEVPKPRRNFIDQIVIVRYKQHRTFISLERNIQRVDRFQIKVVRRLVENENVRLGQNQLAEDQSRLLAA